MEKTIEKQQKSNGNTCSKQFSATFLIHCILLVTIILCINLVSAADFDNIKGDLIIDETTSKYGKINIYNWNIIGKLFDIKTATLELEKNSDICGVTCSAETEIIMYKDGALIDDVRFLTLQYDNSWIEQSIRNYQFYLKIGEEEVEVNDWGNVCDKEVLGNGTTRRYNCVHQVIGTHMETRNLWKEYSLGEWVEAGTFYIRLEGEKKRTRTVDWQITSQGKLIDEWAVWSRKVGIIDQNSVGDHSQTNVEAVEWRAQVFNANISYTIVNVSLKMFKAGAPTTIFVGIKAVDGDDKPTGDDLGNGTIDGTLFGGSPGDWRNATIIPPVNLTMGTNYSMVISCPECDGENRVSWRVIADNSTSYPYGWYLASGDSGASWTSSAFDLMFRTYGEGANSIVILDSPANNSIHTTSEIEFNCSVIVSGAAAVNISLWHNDSGTWELNDTHAITGTSNSTNFTKFLNSNSGEKVLWTCQGCDSDSDCGFGVNQTIEIDSITPIENSQAYNSSTYETATENFEVNITYDTNLFSNIRSTLYYNHTTYTGTQTGTGDTVLFSRGISVPTVDTDSTNETFYWMIGLYNGSWSNFNLSTKNQLVNLTNFQLCNTTFNIPYINFSFEDESEGFSIDNATIPLFDAGYYLGDGSITRTYTFTNNTGNNNYSFCFSPQDRTVNVNFSLQYEDEFGIYPQRTYQDLLALTNTTTNITLYLLSSSDGIYVTFQVQNTAEQPIENVHVTATRVISGSTVTVGEGDTGADGGITFWLNPNFLHTLSFVVDGYDDFTTTLTPTQNSYTITLGGAAAITQDDFYQGITLQINPTNDTLFNDTAYDFQFILTSSFWEVTEFGFVLFNSTGDEVASNSVSANGGTSETNYDVGNTTAYIRMNYYWVIDGNYTNSSRSWTLLSSSGTDWSIKNFFDDFTTYIGGGLFGLDDFGRVLIIFIIIFIFTGIMSFKFGIVSPAGVSSLLFGLILFFDVGLGFIPNPIEKTVPYFPTIFMGLILLGVLFREVYR